MPSINVSQPINTEGQEMTKGTGRLPEQFSSTEANRRVTLKFDWHPECHIHCSLDEAISIYMLFDNPAVAVLKQIKGVLDDPS